RPLRPSSIIDWDSQGLTCMRSITWICTLIVFLANPATSRADAPSPLPTSTFFQDWLKAVVSIEVGTEPGARPLGSDFIVQSSNNHLVLVTAAHVIRDGSGHLLEGLAYRMNESTGHAKLILDSDYAKDGLGGWFLARTEDLAVRFIKRRDTSDMRYIPV